MKLSSRAMLLTACLAALTAGCAGDSSRYPSLAIRDAERVDAAPTPTISAPAPLDSERLERIAELLQTARAQLIKKFDQLDDNSAASEYLQKYAKFGAN